LTGINSVFLGLTVFAWANCIGGNILYNIIDYLTITHFAKNGNAKTAIAGIFSGQLFNFLLGFGVSLMAQSIDGPYEYKIFDFKGTTYDKISDAIVMCVIFGGLFYLIFVFVTAIKEKGVFMKR
jgi:Ca2+/Na+ antiporter